MSGDRGFPVRPVGDRACIIDLPDLDRVLGVAARLRELALPGVVDIVPAACTVLVACDSRAAVRSVAATVAGFEADVAAAGSAGREVTFDVVYDGEDLSAVGEITGLGAGGVIAAHTGTAWRAAFGGFAPGFVYLVGDDPRLRVPRLASPRTAVPAGAVAIADGFSAVYPSESPGGWRLLGRTDRRMWDETRDSPALVAPGDTVRFRAARERVEVAGVDTGAAGAGSAVGSAAGSAAGASGGAPAPALSVERPGMLTLVQDAGRPGHAALGVAESGALDRAALRRANLAVGNPADAAGLEHLGGGLVLRAGRELLIAVAGAESVITVSDDAGSTREEALGAAFSLRAGERLTIGAPERGLRCYLAVRGGLRGRPLLGSAAHDSLSGLGTPPLRAGDALETGGARSAGSVPQAIDPAPSRPDPAPVLRFVPGPRDDWFTPGSLAAFAAQRWTVTPQSNRIGVRLDGAPLARAREGELPTEGMVRGSIQVPPSGLPVLFLADHPVTGGYPVIGTVVDEDLDRAAQLGPGGEVRFVAVDPDDLGEPRGFEAHAPARVEFSIEVDGRRHGVVMAGALAAALDRAGESERARLLGELLGSLEATGPDVESR